MTFRYSATAKENNTKNRPNHNTVTDFNPPRYYEAGSVFSGEEIWVADATNKEPSQYVGDKWLKVLDIDGGPVSGIAWVAIIHQGKAICTLVDNGTGGTPPPTERPNIHIHLTADDGRPDFHADWNG